MEVIGRLQDDVEALAHKLDLAISASDTTVTLSDQVLSFSSDKFCMVLSNPVGVVW